MSRTELKQREIEDLNYLSRRFGKLRRHDDEAGTFTLTFHNGKIFRSYVEDIFKSCRDMLTELDNTSMEEQLTYLYKLATSTEYKIIVEIV